jgi:hypothetical protein
LPLSVADDAGADFDLLISRSFVTVVPGQSCGKSAEDGEDDGD